MIATCKYCNKQFDKDYYYQVFCDTICRRKYYSARQVVRKRSEKRIIKHHFPKFACDCGHIIKLDFFPLERKIWKIVCPECKKKYD